MKRTHRQKSPGGSAFVGKRITKIFGDELYDGTVTSYFSAKETDSNQDLWEISYEDGDVEDMALSNLKAAIALYEKEHAAAGDDDSAVSIGSAQPANKTEMTKEKEDDQEGDEENESLASDEAPEVNESKLAPQDYVGKPVAKKFENELCLGTVTSFTLAKDNDSGEDLYEITYEDGDVEDVLLADLEVELALYNEKQEQDAAASEEQEDEDMSGNESLAHARESKEQQEPAKEVTMADDSDEDEELGATNATTVAAQMAGTSRVTPSPELNAKSNIDADGADLPNVASSAVDSPNAIPAPLLAPLPNLVSSAETGVLSQLPSTVAGAFSDAAHDFAMMQATGGGNSGDEDLPTDMTEEEARIVMSRDRTVDWTEKQKELDKMFEKDASEKFVGIAEFQMPDGFNEDVKLYPHQKDGIRWLLHQETTENAPSFWSQVALGTNKDRLWWRCKITGQFQKRRPNPIRGSILADDMGLGKTLQVIALILSNPAPAGDPRCSVIVCPVTVMSNWKIQIKAFVKPGALKVALYHGPKREEVLKKVKRNEIDVLITSYGTLVSDVNKHEEFLAEKEEEEEERKPKAKKARGNEMQQAWHGHDEDDWEPMEEDSDDEDHHLPASMLKKRGRETFPKHWIFDLHFHRIVLDEAHNIRNSDTGMFKSTSRLSSEYKCATTATPFVNRPSDIHSLLAFLKADPLSDKKLFANFVMKPIMSHNLIGLSRIRTMMGQVALRRNKALVESTIKLVPKEVTIRTLKWSEDAHKSIHDALYKSARAAFIGLLHSGSQTVFRNFHALLTLVLRVRQSCCHGGLVPPEAVAVAEEICRDVENGDIDLDATEGEALLQKLLNVLKGNDEGEDVISKECAVCFEGLEEANAVVLRSCQHVFCNDCLEKVSNSLCPFCREAYEENDQITLHVAQAATKNKKKKKVDVRQAAEDVVDEVHPKIEALLEAIGEMASDEKAVIFSQWTSHLDVIQNALETHGHTYTRIDGTMRPIDRIAAMEDFSMDEEDSPRFILCSLHACGVGINLTRGNVVFVLDPWWNSAVENQAMDRVHRIGQTRPVRSIRFTMENSLEERMVKLQESKAALGKGSLQKLNKEDRKKARITALKDLFEITVQTKWHGYVDDDDDEDLDGFIVADDVVD